MANHIVKKRGDSYNRNRKERDLLGGGSPFELYQPYIDGDKEIAEINREYNARYQRGN